MSEILRSRLHNELNALRESSRYRDLYRSGGLNFGSNDYLGFARNQELQRAALSALRESPLSAGSSRLLPGYHHVHELLESEFAEFVGAESALYFTSGYAANTGLLATLATRHDLILYDKRCHASWYDAVHSSHARSIRFEHNSVLDLESKLQRTTSSDGTTFIIVESIYSMDGDLAPVNEMAELAKRFKAVFIVDEAHASGVIGPNGSGLASSLRSEGFLVISVHTCGKALGSAGAFIACERLIKEYLINRCRQFIFTTALPPLLGIQVRNSIQILATSGDLLVRQLREASSHVRSALRSRLKTWIVPDGLTPIIPVLIGDDRAALDASARLRDRGFDVPAIRPPSVPVGTSRLRLNITLEHSSTDLDAVVEAVITCEREAAR